MIALLAPFYPYNYGTVLQAFALNRAIALFDRESEYITYSILPHNNLDKIRLLASHPKVSLKILSQWLFGHNSEALYTGYDNMIKKNEAFIKSYIPHTSIIYNYYNIGEIVDKYDLIITGSDQTWSPINAYHKILPYFQSFHNSSQKKRSYACSLGVLNLRATSYIQASLADFHNVSVRETYSQNQLIRILGKDVKVVLDPTLLIDSSEWSKYEVSAGKSEKYVLCYLLGNKRSIIEYAERVAKTMNYKLLIIQANNIIRDERVLTNVGVQEFLWLIHNAEHIVTDSFHGTVFSINYSKQFTAFNKHIGNSMDNGRIGDILRRLNIKDHLLNDSEKFIPPTIQYDSVQKMISVLRDESLQYLKEIVNV